MFHLDSTKSLDEKQINRLSQIPLTGMTKQLLQSCGPLKKEINHILDCNNKNKQILQGLGVAQAAVTERWP